MTDADAVTPGARGDCHVCATWPDRLIVDTLWEPASFPSAARTLEVVSGERWEEQLQRCPHCGAHYAYTFDHDSQSGVGLGYTEETLERLFWFETRADSTLTLRNASTRVTGSSLGSLIRDLLATGRPPRERITALEIQATAFGPAPDELGLLTGLNLIWFHPSGLTVLPASIQRLSRLGDLWIAGNPITDLPDAIATLQALTRVDLARTAMLTLRPPLLDSHIRFENYEGNSVPDDWRGAFVADFRRPLVWLSHNGASIEYFNSGAWSHEDRYDLVVRLPADAAGALRLSGELAPFEIARDEGDQIVLECPGRAGLDRIVVKTVAGE